MVNSIVTVLLEFYLHITLDRFIRVFWDVMYASSVNLSGFWKPVKPPRTAFGYVERAGFATVKVAGKVAPKIFFKAAVYV